MSHCLDVAASASLAEQRNIIFDRIGSEQGLSQGAVTEFAQDPNGFLWIGTQEGLNRFDGFRFRSYYHVEEDANSLAHNYIRSIIFDRSETMWVATDGGVSRYLEDSDSFENLELGRLGEERNVYHLFEDSEGNIWAATTEGVAILKPDGSISWLRHSSDDLGSIGAGAVRHTFEDASGQIWIGMEQSGLYVGSVDSGFEQAPLGLDSASIRGIHQDSLGTMWIATFNRGLIEYSPDTGVARNYTQGSGKLDLGSNRIRSILEDAVGQLWFGTDRGLHLWRSDGEFTKYELDLSNPRSISGNTILALYQDKGGVIWAGTYNGISKWNAAVETFPYFRRPAMETDDTQSNNITSFVDESNGNVWIGTLAGLIRWDASIGQLISLDSNSMGLSDSRVMSLGYHKGEVWVGTMTGGVNVIDASKVVRVYSNVPGDPESISSNAITRFYSDRKGRLWVATYGGGVNLYLGDGKFRRYPELGGDHMFSDLRCMDIVEAEDGRFWITTQGGGVVILDAESGYVDHLKNDPKNKASIPSNEVLPLLSTTEGIWIGSVNRGLSFYDFETEQVTRYSKKDGLAGDSVYGLLLDEQGNIWASGGRGLTSFNPDSLEFKIFDTSHGLQSSDFNSGAYAKFGDGSLAFGGNNGFNVFYPKRIRVNTFVPPVRITNFKKFNKSVEFDSPLHAIKQIELGHDESVIGFEFSALDFTAPDKNLYRYKLDGFDRDWVQHTGSREVTYTNLDAGEYVFRVQGSNNDGYWNLEGASLAVSVKPAPWLTWWAYSVYAALLVFSFYLMLRYNSARLQRDAERRYSERLQLYIESLEEASDCILIADATGTLLFANKTITEGLNKSPGEVIGESLWNVLFDELGDVSFAQESLDKEGRYHGEVLLEGSDGNFMTHDVTIAAVQQSTSNELAYVGISRDVTDRKVTEAQLEDYRKNLEQLVAERTDALQKEIAENKAIQVTLADSLQEKELLLKEVHHRVKNNMQVISSLLSIQAHGTGDEAYSTLLNESQQRIKSMALIHETLYQSKDLLKIDFQEYIETLTASLSRSYSVPGVSVHVVVNVENVALDLETAVPCGLIINELVSNALKHAFHEKVGTGIIDINFTSVGCDYDLRIADNGSGLPEGFDPNDGQSMGMDIVSILTSQLEGTLEAQNDDGAVFAIKFPRSVHV